MDVKIEPKEASEGEGSLTNAIEEEVLPNSTLSPDWNPETDRNAAGTWENVPEMSNTDNVDINFDGGATENDNLAESEEENENVDTRNSLDEQSQTLEPTNETDKPGFWTWFWLSEKLQYREWKWDMSRQCVCNK